MACEATTEPGAHYTYKRMNPKGAARIAFGQYLECWQLGLHYAQDALVQCGAIRVHRDNDENGFRTGDTIDTGDNFYINQHTTSNAPDRIGRWSAGCLVGRYPGTHRLFMAICRAMGLAKFDTTVIDGSDFVGFCRVS